MGNTHDPQDKKWWCEFGVKYEQLFVDKVAPILKLDARINPEKETNKYAYDLIVNDQKADLKHQAKPFFKSLILYPAYGIPPRYAVTFNRKDYLRYKNLYPDLIIYFWVEWLVMEMTFGGETIDVGRLAGLYRAPFSQIAQYIEADIYPLHQYKNRVNDTSYNAKDSYLLDLRDMECIISTETFNKAERKKAA